MDPVLWYLLISRLVAVPMMAGALVGFWSDDDDDDETAAAAWLLLLLIGTLVLEVFIISVVPAYLSYRVAQALSGRT